MGLMVGTGVIRRQVLMLGGASLPWRVIGSWARVFFSGTNHPARVKVLFTFLCKRFSQNILAM